MGPSLAGIAKENSLRTIEGRTNWFDEESFEPRKRVTFSLG